MLEQVQSELVEVISCNNICALTSAVTKQYCYLIGEDRSRLSSEVFSFISILFCLEVASL